MQHIAIEYLGIVRDGDFAPKDHQYEMAYGESNHEVT